MKIKIKVCIIIVAIFLGLNVQAGTKKSADTIPFITYKTHDIYCSVPVTMSNHQISMDASQSLQGSNKTTMRCSVPGSGFGEEVSKSNIPIADIKNIVVSVREVVCNSIEDGDVRVWFSMDASGKLGIGISAQSGLEVTFHCRK